MIKLYGYGLSRWIKPIWLLRELGLPCETIPIRLSKGEHRKPEFLAINPLGKVPVLVDGDFQLLESHAMLNYLAEKAPEKNFIPPSGTRQRALCDQWMCFVLSELEQAVWQVARNLFVNPENRRSATAMAWAKEDFAKLCATLETQIGSKPLLGEHFTVADIAMIYTLKWAMLPKMDLFPTGPSPNIQAYIALHTARPHFPREYYAPYDDLTNPRSRTL